MYLKISSFKRNIYFLKILKGLKVRNYADFLRQKKPLSKWKGAGVRSIIAI
jgi:hypothetical protein